jgi:dTMP kinase
MIKNTYPGKFIVFEGLDGSGQSTQAGKLQDWINSSKDLIMGQGGAHLTKEPTNNIIGGIIRGQLTGEWRANPECLQLLFSADRAHHLEREIIPLLEKGVTVISDRYFLSTIAFGASEINDMDWLIGVNKPFLLPDLTFLIKVSPRVCIERINKGRFHIELFEREEALTKVWKNYEFLSKQFENINVINGEKSVEEVFSEIKSLFSARFYN